MKRLDPCQVLLFVAATCSVSAGCSLIDDRAAIEARLQEAQRAPARTITATDLEGLPPPVARYLTRTGIVGRPSTRAMRARGEGTIILEGQGKVSLSFEQYNTVLVTRDVLLESSPWALVTMEGHDSLDGEGRGRMSIRIDGLPFQESYGPELDVSALVTYLAELPMYPSAYLGDDVAFDPIDDHTAAVRLTAHGRTVSGVFTFDAAHELVTFVTDDRYRTVDGKQVPQRWSSRCLEYRDVDGLHLCVRVTGTWHEEGQEPLEYADFQMNELELDVFELF